MNSTACKYNSSFEGLQKVYICAEERPFVRKFPTLFLFFIVTSCLNQANCYITASNLVKVNLKKSDNSPAAITFTSITVSGTSLTFIPDGPVTALNLPVDPATSETTFLFKYSAIVEGVTTNKSDTLTLSYSSEIQLISEECGALQYQKDLAIVSTDFPKTKLINSSLLTTVASNLEIYF